MSIEAIDPDLARQLDDAGADEPVEAVLLLHDDSSKRGPIDVEALMRHVHDQDIHAEMNYMPRMGVLVVRATSQAIRALIIQPEVEIASANHLPPGLHP
jgi:hypothetical protein